MTLLLVQKLTRGWARLEAHQVDNLLEEQDDGDEKHNDRDEGSPCQQAAHELLRRWL